MFDAYLVVDWSASCRPRRPSENKNTLWACGWERDGALMVPDTLPTAHLSTRAAARCYVAAFLRQQVELAHRVLVGFDFAYAYPHGFAAALGLRGPGLPWRLAWDALSRLLEDGKDNRNNRFEVAAGLNARIGDSEAAGPFWGCPGSQTSTLLRPKRTFDFPYPAGDGTYLPQFRRTEILLRNSGKLAHEAWKVFYSGSVGGQMLTGIPVVAALRDAPHLAAWSRVWPFETGFTDPLSLSSRPLILHAEVWPGILTPAQLPRGRCLDERQVRGLIAHFAALDEQGRLIELFSVPADDRTAALEEGWTLGAWAGVAAPILDL